MYVIFEYDVMKSVEDAMAEGWHEYEYHEMVNEDIADVVRYYDTYEAARKDWFNYYSGSQFEFSEFDICLAFYALAKCNEDEDTTDIIEISCGDVTADEIAEYYAEEK